MTFELYSEAVLTRDLPEHNLRRGDVVVVIDHHVARDGEEGHSIEVFNATGDTIAVTTVPESHLEPLRSDEVLCARVAPTRRLIPSGSVELYFRLVSASRKSSASILFYPWLAFCCLQNYANELGEDLATQIREW